MGLDFSKTKAQSAVLASTPEAKNEIEVVEAYDIVEDRQQMNNALVGSQEVDDIVSTIEVGNLYRLAPRLQRRYQRLRTSC